ncbi:Nn.00g045950.m01.CDS01 [Neocucurbitaria sp. VM-36]
MSKIVRLTLFKISEPAAIQDAIQKYSTLSNDAVKDGKQYIQLASATPTHDDPRSQGYTLVARTVFGSKSDMDYYDNECQAHTAIKALVKPKVAGPPLVVYMDN